MADERQGTLRGLVPEDLMKFRWLEEIALSPDGEVLAYTVRRPDCERNGYQVDVYLMDLEDGDAVRMSVGEGRGGSLSWSRDGERPGVRVAGRRRGNVGADVDRTGCRRTSSRWRGLHRAGWTGRRTGGWLACVRWTEDRRGDEVAAGQGSRAPSVKVVRRLRYKLNGPGWVEDRYQHLWVLELGSRGSGTVDRWGVRLQQAGVELGWRRLACTAMARERNIPLGHGQIGILDLESGEQEMLMAGWRGAAVSPQWRGDDGAIAFAGFDDEPPVNTRHFYGVWLCELESRQAKALTEDLDQTVGNYAVADQRAGLANITIKWPGGEGRIYYLLTKGGATHLYSVTESGAWQEEVGGKAVAFEYSGAVGGRVVYGAGEPE